jgi:hypothetical protein
MGCSIHVKDLQLNALGCEAESCQHEIRHILAEVEVDTTEIHLHRDLGLDFDAFCTCFYPSHLLAQLPFSKVYRTSKTRSPGLAHSICTRQRVS